MPHPHRLESLIEHLVYESHQADLLLQAGLLIAAGAISWLIAYWFGNRIAKNDPSPARVRRIFRAIALPIVMLTRVVDALRDESWLLMTSPVVAPEQAAKVKDAGECAFAHSAG